MKSRQRITSQKRSGFILVTALIIVLLGAALSIGIFALANSMYTTDLVNRKDYEEQIQVNQVIESAKGFIVNENYRRSDDVSGRRIVLHGRGGTSDDYFLIRSLNDLQVCMPKPVEEALSRDIPLTHDRNFRRWMTLQVYDANYRVDDLRFIPTSDAPPSLSPSARLADSGGQDAWSMEGVEIVDPSTKTVSGDALPAQFYKHFGAYLIRVRLFREGLAEPVRQTEEMFFMTIPPTK